MATAELQMSPQLEQIHGEIRDLFRALSNGFQRLDKMKDSNRQSKQLEELTGKMRECIQLQKWVWCRPSLRDSIGTRVAKSMPSLRIEFLAILIYSLMVFTILQMGWL